MHGTQQGAASNSKLAVHPLFERARAEKENVIVRIVTGMTIRTIRKIDTAGMNDGIGNCAEDNTEQEPDEMQGFDNAPIPVRNLENAMNHRTVDVQEERQVMIAEGVRVEVWHGHCLHRAGEDPIGDGRAHLRGMQVQMEYGTGDMRCAATSGARDSLATIM